MLAVATVVAIDIFLSWFNHTVMIEKTGPRPHLVLSGPTSADKVQSSRTKAFYQLIGGRVRSRRIELGFTQEKLACAVGAARTSITNLECGRQHLPSHVLLAVADALDLELTALIPSRDELTNASQETVPLTVGNGHVQMVSPRTASVITELLADRHQKQGGQDA
jgi:transcriptional regulator with XRE-family HTH domain